MRANLALSIISSEILENSTLLQLIVYSRMYRNEHRTSKNLTTLFLSLITTRLGTVCITSKYNMSSKYPTNYHHWSNLKNTEV